MFASIEGRSAALLLPPTGLAGAIFAAIVRDTRDLMLSDEDRLNFFPASPLVCLTLVLQGELRLLSSADAVGDPDAAPIQPSIFVTAPQATPTISWSVGPVVVVSVGVYPDAWARVDDHQAVLAALAAAFGRDDDAQAGWNRFCAAIGPAWPPKSEGELGPIALWARALAARAALTGAGRSARAIERRVKRWSGQTNRTLGFFSAFENLHRLSVQSGRQSLADLALQAGYADQSHMGRVVKRGTGFSPARLNRLIATKEAFWCYRLLGERF